MIRLFIKGADGEIEVRNILAKLPNAYYSIHDFVAGKKGNIDFVVVGPNGVWTFEVKNSIKGGEITYKNGLLCKKGYPIAGHGLKQAYAEKMDLQDFIKRTLGFSISVNPVLVFANYRDTMRFGYKSIEGVQVIGIQWVKKLIQETQTDTKLTPEQCIAIRDEVKKYASII